MPTYVSDAEPAEAVPTAGVGISEPASCNVCNCGPYGDSPNFPSAKNRAARLAALARQGQALSEGDRALATQSGAARTHGGMLTADDFAVALGKPMRDREHIDKDVADAFARAWAEDGEVLRYRNTDYREADEPPGMNSRAAAGWKPVATGTAVMEPENQLFEAYGASYTEAYAVALALEFREEKPVPDDATGDVTGLVSSILHPPSGEPILLGTVLLEDKRQEEDDFAPAAEAAEEKPLPLGRRVVRYLLLALGAGALALAGLYFTGYLL